MRVFPVPVVFSAILVAVAGPRAEGQVLARGPAAVSGRVLDADTREPLPFVVVDLIDQKRRVETDADGEFRIEDLSPQLVTIRLRQIGYPVVERSLNLFAGRVAQVEYVLRKPPPRLEEVRVTAARAAARTASNLMMAGFEERKRLGIGKYYGEEELARHSQRRVTDVLRDASGVRFVGGSGGEQFLASNRTAVGIGNARDQSACYLQVVIDGMLVWSPETSSQRSNSFDPPDMAHFVTVSDLVGIEVYSGLAGVPAMYRRQGNSCGVILFWTRRGDYVPVIR